MHIVYVCREYPPSLRGGGIASYIKEMAHGMAARGHQVTVVAASDDTRRTSVEDDGGVRVLRLSGGDFWVPDAEPGNKLFKFRPLYRYRQYRQRVREAVLSLKDVDIIEVADFGSEGTLLHDIGVPVTVRLHTPSSFDRNTLAHHRNKGWKKIWNHLLEEEDREIATAQYLTSCSQALKDWTVEWLGVEAERIEVIFNPVNPHFESAVKGQKEENEPKTVLFAGTIDKVKGCGDLLEAGRILKGISKEDFEMHLYGKCGMWADRLKEQAKDAPWFQVRGKLQREMLQAYYAKADVVVFPSWWDNMPMVCLEAMLNGAVVIASNSGGMAEIITDSEDGFLLPPHEPRLWAEKIAQVFKMTTNERQQISTMARKRIAEHFSTAVITQEMEAYYTNVIKDFKNR